MLVRALSLSALLVSAAQVGAWGFGPPGTAGATATSPTASSMARVTAFMTLYGYADNSPPGTAIAHPCLHAHAGGTGTYADPITFATDVAEEPWCTIIYVPYMHRYFIHEDECSECDSNWKHAHLYRFDMWAGGDARSRHQPERGALFACESTWTRGNSPTDPANPTVLVDPPPDLPVTSDPIFSPPAGCWQPVTVSDPGDQTTYLGTGPVSLPVRATDSSPGATLAFSAVGLPDGLAIDPDSGVIGGTPTRHERTKVTVTASDGLDAASVTFHWKVKTAHERKGSPPPDASRAR